MRTVNQQIYVIACRVVNWANSVRPGPGAMGYCMSGRWEDFYQNFFFPDHTWNAPRIDMLFANIRLLGWQPSLYVKEVSWGNFLYVQLKKIEPLQERAAL